MVAVIFWLIFSLVVGAVAGNIGRSFGMYFVLSLILSPLIGFIILAINGKATQEEILKNSKHIFYCDVCNTTYSSYGEHTEYCPNCKKELIETTILADDWRKYNSEKKESLKKAFSEGQFWLDNLNKTISQVSLKADNSADEIKKFKELLDMGAITQEEYDMKKKQILGL